MFRLGLQSVLSQAPDMEVVAEAANSVEAIQAMHAVAPDVTVLDLRMPGGSGIDLLREVKALHLKTQVLILSSYASEEEIYQALSAGADGYLLKDVGRSELLGAIRDLHAGRRHIPAPIQAVLAERTSAPTLTSREMDVLHLMVRGLTNREIAAIIGSSANTIRNQTISIFSKLGVADRAEAVSAALQRGIILTQA
jgi:DNA-binding NarL/FixJ family response regulator